MQSETIGSLAAALAKAQGAIKPAPMDRDNPFFKSRYATLTSLWESARAALSANGLAVVQTTDFNEVGDLILITTLIHSSGEWVGSVYPIVAKDKTAQAVGSGLTYARRYAFGALVGLTSDDDDDGEAATHGTNGAKAQPANARKDTPPAVAANNGTTNGSAMKAFHATGTKAFGADWNDARRWLIHRYTTKATPDNVRESAKDLTTDELSKLAADIEKYNGKLIQQWQAYKAEVDAELDAIDMQNAEEMEA